MQKAGIVRNEKDLASLKAWLETYRIDELLDVACEGLTLDQLSKINAVIVSWLIAESALMRKESRGGHFRTDYPVENDDRMASYIDCMG